MASATQPLCPVPRLRNPATVAALASIGLYAAALCLLCLLLRQMGWEAFYLELSSVVGNLFQRESPLHAVFSLAVLIVNPLLWVGWFGLLRSRLRLAGIAGVSALLLGAFVVLMWWGPAAFMTAFVWLWLASMAVVAAAGFWQQYARRRRVSRA